MQGRHQECFLTSAEGSTTSASLLRASAVDPSAQHRDFDDLSLSSTEPIGKPILETAPQGSRRLQSSFSKEWHPEKMVNLQKRCFEIFEYFMIFAPHCLRPPQNLVLFLEAGEGPGKPGSALEGVGGSRGHPWSAPKQNKLKSQKSISVIFRDFHEFCSCPPPSPLH